MITVLIAIIIHSFYRELGVRFMDSKISSYIVALDIAIEVCLTFYFFS